MRDAEEEHDKLREVAEQVREALRKAAVEAGRIRASMEAPIGSRISAGLIEDAVNAALAELDKALEGSE